MNYLSENFTKEEMKCNGKNCCGGVYIVRKSLLVALEKLRKRANDKPLFVTRGFSCFTHNSKIPNSAKDSAHCHGYGVDIYSNYFTIRELARYAAEDENIKGIGIYQTHLHIDTRPGKRRWWSSEKKNN